MIRAAFFATGLFVTLVGSGFLAVDKMILNVREDAPQMEGFRGLFSATPHDHKVVFDPPEWAAFSMMSIGTVTMLYAAALPKRNA
jgi:hypothetical protein